MSFESKERDFLMSVFVTICLACFCVGKMRLDYLDTKVSQLEAEIAKLEQKP